MSNRLTDTLFQLIHALEKAEKRNFKLYVKRNSAKEDLKIIQLFDALDKQSEYDERALLKRLPDTEKPQLANLKTHLYKQLLASLRVLKSTESVELQMNEQLDYARILYNKGLFQQSLKMLEKARELATANQKFNFLSQVTSLEKKIETLYITSSMSSKVQQLSQEALEVSTHIFNVSRLSNLALQLYTWYITNGHARNPGDEESLKVFFANLLPHNAQELSGFYERLYLYQSYVWFAFIRQDFLQYYRYSQKWVDLFAEQPAMIRVEGGHYIKGLHNLLNAHFDLRNFKALAATLRQFEAFAETSPLMQHNNFRISTFVYITAAKLNQHLIEGTFKQGILQVPAIQLQMETFKQHIDKHRLMVFNYKIATLYFGVADYNHSIDYLQQIINDNSGLRHDLQCYARLLHMMAHFELGNDTLVEYLMKSVYRYMANMKNLTVIEQEMFKFLRTSFKTPGRKLKTEFEALLQRIKKYENNRFETRAFAYLDVVSWVESKLEGKPMSDIIHRKYLESKHR
ncbi:MAG: hypothetical protein EAY75_04380 [Bacteroidetes bacterium]|nr:MAG: hypothetical protein EAY75_04380 [Bacteroidota bacterium]